MKKWILPIALLLAAIALIAYLRFDGLPGSGIDGETYLTTRAHIDSLELQLWNVRENVSERSALMAKLDSAWNQLEHLRDGQKETPVIEESKQLSEVSEKAAPTKTWLVAGIALCVILIVAICLLLRQVFRKKSMNDLEAQKAAISENVSSDSDGFIIEERFRNPKGGFSGEDLTFTRTRGGKRPSIIDEANAFAEKERLKEQEKAREKELLDDSANTATAQTAASFAFENENGELENRIFSTNPDSSKPALRPTAKQRITTALQSLSSALTRPRGIPRDQTMHLRTQSRNTIDMTALSKSALDVTRFDKERADLTMVKKLKGQGCTPGMIAKKMNISQDEADTLITKVRESE